jgi:hypothetical protein
MEPDNDAPMTDFPVNEDVSPPHPDHVRKWNAKQLLEYLKPTLSLFSDSSQKSFERQEVTGKTFLKKGCDSKFYREFMPAGPSDELAEQAMIIRTASSMKSRFQLLHLKVEAYSLQSTAYFGIRYRVPPPMLQPTQIQRIF